MAISTYDDYKRSVPHGFVSLNKQTNAVGVGRMYTTWLDLPFAGTTPSTATACTGATAGSLTRGLIGGLAGWVKTVHQSRTGIASTLILDRLSHQGGLSGTVTTEQTTNLPTAALTRYTSGVGVMAFIEVFTTVGATVATLTCSYTNSEGSSGRTSPVVQFGGTGDRSSGVFIPIPLQIGDIGVRSVESVTLSGTTGTAGNFGITLAKPLFSIPAWDEALEFKYDAVQHLGLMFDPILADACLMSVSCNNSTDTFHRAGVIELIKQV